jgi:UDP-N-acetylglucosamine--N-acetylmuramyl-(pentapeptide) pyrophosphoryl-undecaprenol N-acetylglucosamine transferase
MSRVLMILAGGTGGHVFPGLAVAAYLRERGWEPVWLGTRHGMEAKLVPQYGIPFDGIRFSSVRGKGFLRLALGPLSIAWAFLQSIVLVFKRRPDVVLGMGGYVSLPSGLAAVFLHRPLAIHDSNAVAGLANRALARFASRICTAFPNAFDRRLEKKVELTGNPLRSEIAAVASPESRFAGREGPLKLLVVGGSLGAQALNALVPQALALLASKERPVVTHQAGAKHIEALRAAYAEAGVEAECLPFIDDMAARYASCDLVICRSGALTVSELAAAGVASILVPFPAAIADEQTRNARYLADRGAALLEPQSGLGAERLAGLLATLDRERLLAMAKSAYAQGQRDATARVAKICEDLAVAGGAARSVL